MKKLLLGVLAVLGLLCACQPAVAQYASPFVNPRYGVQGSPFNAPPISPYLNLVRSGNPAIEYYLGTIPEFDRQRFQNLITSGLPGLEPYAGQVQGPIEFGGIPKLPQTGHLSAFQSFGSYYYGAAGYGGTGGVVQQRPYYPYNPNLARMLPR